MFKGMYPIFWIGLLITYGLLVIFWIIEINSNVGTVHTSIFGIPAPWIYVSPFMVWILPCILAFVWYYVPKKQAERSKQKGERG